MHIKKIFGLIASAFLFTVAPAFCEKAFFQSDNYSITLKYNKEIIPGNAVFVRMNVTPGKSVKKQTNALKAELQLLIDGKLSQKAPFYQLNAKKSKNNYEMLSGVPVSLWIESELNCQLKVVFSLAGEQTKEFFLPSVFKLRNFDNEDIYLNESNTAIRSDTSPERMAQIEKLNNIFFSANYTSIHQLKSFVSPTESTRFTAHCGDRRTYIYSSGKKSKNLHFGNDYGIPTGSDVRACAEGRVVLAQNRISTGWSLVIEHLPGLYSVYYHLSELKTSEGDLVRQGQLIAKSGATGMATGPHLHWEMRLNGSAVIPEFFLTDFTFEED